MLIEGGCVMSRDMSQRIAEALLLFDFDLDELVEFSEAEIRLISAAGDEHLPDMPDDDDHDIQRTYMQRVLQRLQADTDNNHSAATDQWGKKKRHFSDDNERES
jgi:hypothetical protein